MLVGDVWRSNFRAPVKGGLQLVARRCQPARSRGCFAAIDENPEQDRHDGDNNEDSTNQRQSVFLFFGLMWNDFSITLVEQVGILTSVMKDHGATNTKLDLRGPSLRAAILRLIGNRFRGVTIIF